MNAGRESKREERHSRLGFNARRGVGIEQRMSLGVQVVWLFVLAIPIACVAWTVTHEEIFREPREFCLERSSTAQTLFRRKFFYIWTCEYCFSHYVTIIFLLITRYKLLFV